MKIITRDYRIIIGLSVMGNLVVFLEIEDLPAPKFALG